MLRSRLAPLELPSFNESAGPQPLGEMWTLRRGARQLRCPLTTHASGWEIRTVYDGELLRSQVCKSRVCKTQNEVFRIAEEWKQEAVATGWRPGDDGDR